MNEYIAFVIGLGIAFFIVWMYMINDTLKDIAGHLGGIHNELTNIRLELTADNRKKK